MMGHPGRLLQGAGLPRSKDGPVDVESFSLPYQRKYENLSKGVLYG